MNWLPIISGLWVFGWLVSCLIYVRQNRQEAVAAKRPFSWKTALPRLFLLAMFWPLFALGWLYFKWRGEV